MSLVIIFSNSNIVKYCKYLRIATPAKQIAHGVCTIGRELVGMRRGVIQTAAREALVTNNALLHRQPLLWPARAVVVARSRSRRVTQPGLPPVRRNQVPELTDVVAPAFLSRQPPGD